MPIRHHKSEQILAHETAVRERNAKAAKAEEIGTRILRDAEARLRDLHIQIDRVRWALDTARSELQKAQPTTGYRSTPGLGDKPWDVQKAEQKVFVAETNLLRLAEIVSPDPNIERA